MKKKRITTPSKFEMYNSVRGSWGGVNPVTKVEQSKAQYDRKKEKAFLKKVSLEDLVD